MCVTEKTYHMKKKREYCGKTKLTVVTTVHEKCENTTNTLLVIQKNIAILHSGAQEKNSKTMGAQ